MLLLDTDVAIDVQRRHPSAAAWTDGLPALPSIPGFVRMELAQGARNGRELAASVRAAMRFPVVWPTPSDLDFALRTFERFHLTNRLGLIDALIGATAVGLGATLCTFNARHFRVVPGLRTFPPYRR